MSRTWTYELFIRGPRQRLAETLAGWGETLGGDRFKLARAEALAWLGPNAAVISIASDAPADEAESLLSEIAEIARPRGWELSDAQGAIDVGRPDVLLARFRQAPPPPGEGLPDTTADIRAELAADERREALKGVLRGLTDDPWLFRRSPSASWMALALCAVIGLGLWLALHH